MSRVTPWLPWIRSRIAIIVGGAALLVALVVLFALPGARIADAVSVDAKPVAELAAVTPVISYQARLTNPTTGAPLSGTLSFSLRIYNVSSGGVALWMENKDIAVNNGLLSTHLGDTVPLSAAIFNGQDLWLGIKIGSDAETTPRQRLLPVAYAMYSDNADRLDGQDSAFFRNAGNINAGTVNDANLPATVTRDSEVMSIVTANDGAGSNVNADLLDGLDSTNFFRGVRAVQLANQSIAPGATVTWSSWGYSTDNMVMWWAVPRTQGGQLSTSVETLLEGCCGAGQGLITYLITVRNTSAINTNYDLIRYGFSQ